VVPVIAIVGRPNVGKSTLFNVLTKSRAALVVDLPGVTRDRQYGEGVVGMRPFIAIDTGGLGIEETELDLLSKEQAWHAIEEADVILFLVDARAGLVPNDYDIAKALRSKNKKVYLVVNKIDGLDIGVAKGDFYALGLSEPIPIAASHGRGVNELIALALKDFPVMEETPEEDKNAGIKITIVGRPNVGKSTLVNRLLGEERVVVFDKPGTTRDSIYIPLERFGDHYTLIDTAGVRKRARISEVVEKFSVVKTLQAIQDSHVVILLIDATDGITDQDLGLLGFVIETGRSLVVAVNKWDGLEPRSRTEIKHALTYRLAFVDFAKVHFISALHGTGVGNLWDSIKKCYESATKVLSTSIVTRVLELAVEDHPPPMVHSRRIKLRYAHSGGHNPPLIVIHGNQTESVPDHYKRYLMGFFRKKLKLVGTPIRLEFKTSDNPYAGRRNTLTKRQLYKKKRLMDFVKKKKR